ncbi:MAG TPA: NEW3 domain-containing protein, partial [Chloroflexota bacterium]|nr:NEW3 domain-containing protein [Chloroflexota bacterium]
HRFRSVIPAAEKEDSFFDGIDVSLLGIATLAKDDPGFVMEGLRKINTAVEDAISKFSSVHPERSAPPLANGLKETAVLLEAIEKSSLSDDSKYGLRKELEVKRAQFNNALAESLGLSLTATVAPAVEPNPRFAMFMGDPATMQIAIPGQTFGVKVHVVSQSSEAVTLRRTVVESAGQKENWPVTPASASNDTALANDKPVEATFSVTVPQNPQYTRPYFSRPDIEQSYYNIDDERYLNRPLPPYPVVAWAEFNYNGVPIRIGEYVQSVERINGQGSVFEPLAVAPAIGVSIPARAGIVALDAKSFPLTTIVHSNVKGPAKGTVHLELPSGWKSEPASAPFATSDDGQDQSMTFTVVPSRLAEKEYKITATAEYNGRNYSEGYTVTGYPTLRPYYLYRPSTYKTSGVDVKVAPGLKVGYVMGSGDDVPSALEHLGIKVTFLAPADIASGDLGKFDAILLGVRAYAVREDLKTYNSRLLDYVKNGGAL